MSTVIIDTRPDTHQKALRINLDKLKYGTFAEIGAGQEVASWFFRVGGASGTVAKTMCAYDMRVSDAVYGKSDRYVSKTRLQSMLNHEYQLLVERLAGIRGDTTSFFVFADTVSARNFSGTNECHGWMGLRFQTAPNKAPCDIILHVNMYDTDNLRQQQALGVLGINLLYSAFYEFHAVDPLLILLLDGIGPGRIEIDYIELNGLTISSDPLAANLSLLKHGLTRAVVFDNGKGVAPTELFHNRPVLIERGSYRALNNLFSNEVNAAKKLLASKTQDSDEPLFVIESSFNSLLKTVKPTEDEMAQLTKKLCDIGNPVMISNYSEAYHLTGYLRRFTKEPISFLMSIALMMQILQDDRYSGLAGGILEASARLLGDNSQLYVYPMEAVTLRKYLEQVNFNFESFTIPAKDKIGVNDVMPVSELQHLYRYLVGLGFIVPI